MSRPLLAIAIAIALCLPLAAHEPKAAMPVVTDERVAFAPGGAIEVTGSVDELNIEGWDEPNVEITVTRSTYRKDTPRDQERTKRQLGAIAVTAEPEERSRTLRSTRPFRSADSGPVWRTAAAIIKWTTASACRAIPSWYCATGTAACLFSACRATLTPP